MHYSWIVSLYHKSLYSHHSFLIHIRVPVKPALQFTLHKNNTMQLIFQFVLGPCQDSEWPRGIMYCTVLYNNNNVQIKQNIQNSHIPNHGTYQIFQCLNQKLNIHFSTFFNMLQFYISLLQYKTFWNRVSITNFKYFTS